MSGIIGRFYTVLEISLIGEDPYLFHAYIIKARLVLYHFVPVDLYETQSLMRKGT